jgi:hypothetical protein
LNIETEDHIEDGVAAWKAWLHAAQQIPFIEISPKFNHQANALMFQTQKQFYQLKGGIFNK